VSRERPSPNGATIRFEVRLCQAADALRNNMDASEYKHVALGLIFLKYISLQLWTSNARRAPGWRR
jgi:type I restriction enzyme M protein